MLEWENDRVLCTRFGVQMGLILGLGKRTHKMSLKQLAGPQDVRKYSEQNKTKETIQTNKIKQSKNKSLCHGGVSKEHRRQLRLFSWLTLGSLANKE